MRHFKGVILAVSTATALTTTALAACSSSPSLPLQLQATDATFNLLPMHTQFYEQIYADCPPVTCRGGGSR